MDATERARLRELAGKATPGAWVALGGSIGAEVHGCTCGQGHNLQPHEPYCGLEGPVITGASEEDAEFIAAARTAVPELLAALAAAEARLAAVQALVDDHLVCTCDGADDVVLADKLRAVLAGERTPG